MVVVKYPRFSIGVVQLLFDKWGGPTSTSFGATGFWESEERFLGLNPLALSASILYNTTLYSTKIY